MTLSCPEDDLTFAPARKIKSEGYMYLFLAFDSRTRVV